MKKYIAAVLSCAMAVSLVGCTNEPSNNEVVPSALPTTEATQVLKTSAPKITYSPAENNTINGMKVEFEGAEIIQDQDFNPALRVYILVTNISDVTQSLNAVLAPRVMQGDIMLNTVKPLSSVRYDGVSELDIRPGTVVRCTEVFALSNTSENVEVAYYDVMGMGDTNRISKVFDLNALSEKPDVFFVELVPEPGFVDGFENAGAIDGFEVSLEKYETVDLIDGEKGIRIYVDFKNNTANTVVFSNELILNIFQDNVELVQGEPADAVTEDNLRDNELKSGRTLTFAVVCRLTSESPVEVEIGSYQSDTKIGTVYTVAE